MTPAPLASPLRAAMPKPLPVQAQQASSNRPTPRPMPSIPLHNGLVLVVDDVRINRYILCRMLHSVGFSTVEAENGADALDLLRSTPTGHFAAIVLDLCMPVLNGYDTVRAIRTMELASSEDLRLPIFCCTSEQLDECMSIHPEHTVHQHGLLCGFDEVMAKPTNITTMRSLLDKYTSSVVSA